MTVNELRTKRATLWNTMEGFLDTHRNDKGVLSAEDDATYTDMEKDLDDLTNEIKRMERREAYEAELSKPVNAPITEKPERTVPAEKTGRASSAYKVIGNAVPPVLAYNIAQRLQQIWGKLFTNNNKKDVEK